MIFQALEKYCNFVGPWKVFKFWHKPKYTFITVTVPSVVKQHVAFVCAEHRQKKSEKIKLSPKKAKNKRFGRKKDYFETKKNEKKD